MSTNINLKLFNLPILNSIDDFSDHLRISKQSIYILSNYSHRFYKVFDIPKKGSGKRTISQPSRKLKAVQSWILNNILYKIYSSIYSTAYDKGNSIRHNAEIHKGNSNILIVDLKDFFDTITSQQVFSLFKRIGYNNTISTILTKLCTFNGCLPQGGVCSGKIANLIAWNLDTRLSSLCAKRGINYSRYADDLAFSGFISKNLKTIIPIIYRIINDENLKVNYKKTRLLDQSSCRKLTGLTLYQDTFGIGNRKKKILRAKIFNFLTNIECNTTSEFHKIYGHLSYLNAVDKERYYQLKNYIKKLQSNNKYILKDGIKFKFIKESIENKN